MENYVGEIRIFAGSYAPENWAFCNGKLLPISGYEALYTLIGTIYGGDGQTTFALPNLQSRVVVGQGQAATGSNYLIGMTGGQEAVTLINQHLPVHQHPILSSSSTAVTGSPTGQSNPANAYFSNRGGSSYGPNSDVRLSPHALNGRSSVAGSSQPHSNIQPVLAINYIIALTGVYPSFD